jgi:hypoxanthine phosphoribosyltransferase
MCVLLDKPSRRQVDLSAHYTGFQIEDVFVVGYGLDYGHRFRELPYLAVLTPESKS